MVFDKNWFQENNEKLCYLANHKTLKYWFRRLLCIDKDIKWNEKILTITPNSFTKDAGLQYFNRSALLKTQSENPNETRLDRRLARKILVKIEKGKIEDKKFLLPALTTDFRTHEKFGKRLYYGLKPLWYILHFWDWSTSIQPALNCGFDTLTVYPAAGENTPVDGIMGQATTNQTWATVRDGAGNEASSTVADYFFCFISSGANSNQWNTIYRSIFLFDTSALTSSATISAAVLSLYGSLKNDGFATPATPNIDIYTSSPASTSVLATSDYTQIGTTSQTGSPISYASFSTTGYNDFTFDATGRGNISKTGISKFGARNANHDVANSAPTWSSSVNCYLYGYFADQGATTYDPKLVVTYTTVVGPAKLKTWNGLETAKIKTINGLEIAKVKTINGLP